LIKVGKYLLGNFENSSTMEHKIDNVLKAVTNISERLTSLEERFTKFENQLKK